MYAVCFHVYTRTVKGMSYYNDRCQTLEVLHLIRVYQRPELWRDVNSMILDDGWLNVSTVITPDNIDDLVYVLTTDVAAKDIQKLR